jgi:hypothetical protein
MIGEYDWNGTKRGGNDLATFLATLEASPAIGSLSWVLIPHADAAGFADHNDGYEIFYPGRNADERRLTALMTAHAQRLPRATVAAIRAAAPPAPSITAVTPGRDQVELRWRGSAGAATYTVERRAHRWAPWRTIGAGISDQRVISSGPVWIDRNPQGCAASTHCSYRVVAVAPDGQRSQWSTTAAVATPR